MSRYSWVIAILLSVPILAQGLSTAEISGLENILKGWPALSLTSPPWSLSNLSLACTPPGFYGLACSTGEEPHIVSFDCRRTFLKNPIPAGFANLTWLESLSLQNCEVSGTLNATIFASTNLSLLVLSGEHGLTGSLPADLFRIPSLASLELEGNGFRGTLPANIGDAQKLTSLKIFEDRISGTIPPSITSLPKLETLALYTQKLQLVLPPGFETLPLTDLQLHGFSSYRGPCPLEIFKMANLERLFLGISGITGPVPPELGQLTQLQILELWSPFVGPLPPTIGNLRKLEEIDLSTSSITGPVPPEIGNWKKLKRWRSDVLESRGLGQLPDAIGDLTMMNEFSASSAGISGTVPLRMTTLSRLSYLQMADNRLEGFVPLFSAALAMIRLSGNLFNGTLDHIVRNSAPFGALILSNNRISGTIPAGLKFYHLDLANNLLEGPIPDNEPWTMCRTCDFSSNNLTGTIPTNLAPSTQLETLLLANNRLTGTLPPQYAQIALLRYLDVSDNQLTGSISEAWNAYSDIPLTALSVAASRNSISGTIPDLSLLTRLKVLKLSHNNLDGILPSFPLGLEQLYLSKNALEGNFISLAAHESITHLDLSSNQFEGVVEEYLITNALLHLDLSNNHLTGALPDLSSEPAYPLQLLDLSHNNISGTIPSFSSYQSLVSCLLNDNLLEGQELFDADLPQLTHLDISNNRLAFNLRLLLDYPNLIIVVASGNRLTGTPSVLHPLKSLMMADFANNALNAQLKLEDLQHMFSTSLRQLYLENNPTLPTNALPDPAIVGAARAGPPWRTTQSQPSPTLSDFVSCFALSFVPNSTMPLVFAFDETLFNWAQCDCMQDYYGSPPANCYEAPPETSARGRLLSVNANSYIYSTTYKPHLDPAIEDIRTSTTFTPQQSILQTEDCIDSLAAAESNCRGLNLTLEFDSSPSRVLEMFNAMNADQCQEGSEGRLCSRCRCDPSQESLPSEPGMDPRTDAQESRYAKSIQSCYYKSGFRCKKCTHIFSDAQSAPLVIGVVVVVFLVSTGLMFIVLRSRRRVRDKPWEKLSIWIRIWYRLVGTSKSGFISILVAFVQILAGMTHWDNYILRPIAQLSNGKLEGLGVDCLFPRILPHPVISLAVQLVLPIALAILVAASAGAAELIYRCANRNKSSEDYHLNASDFEYSSTSLSLLSSTNTVPKKREVEYQARALAASTALAVLQFFYFGTSLTATEYFFATVQAHTGVKYVQAHPWMLYSDARSLRGISIPWLVCVVIGYPLAFIIFAWLVRHKTSAPKVTSYVGSLFLRYRLEFFWWELVNVLKKLTIALLLRGVPASNPMQVASISLVIGAPMMVQVSVRPWKRYGENVMDGMGGILLIFSLFISSTLRHSKTSSAFYFIVSLDALYFTALLILIIHNLATEQTEYQRVWETSFGKFEILDENGLSSRFEDPSTSSMTFHSPYSYPALLSISQTSAHARSMLPEEDDN